LSAIAAVPNTLVGAAASDDPLGVDEILRLSDVRGRPVTDATGRAIGRVADLAVDHADAYPRVVSVDVRRGRSTAPAPWSAIVRFGAEEVIIDTTHRDAAPDGLRLVRDLLDAQVVDIAGRRLARVGEIELALCGPELRAVAVDVGLAPVARRLGLRRLSRRLPSEVIGWEGIHFATGRGHRVQLASPAAAVHHLSPPELAEVVSRLAPERGAELLEAVAPRTASEARRRHRPARRRHLHVMRARKRAPS
jgi:sporulation protein YlmC with PRC-barrel domain